MGFIERYYKLEQVHQFIKMKATGNPNDFSRKINKSRRSLYNIIDELKNMGARVTYNKQRETFEYQNDFDITLKVEGKNILGGQKTTHISLQRAENMHTTFSSLRGE